MDDFPKDKREKVILDDNSIRISLTELRKSPVYNSKTDEELDAIADSYYALGLLLLEIEQKKSCNNEK
jgi:uncharacterized protein YrrD